MSDIGKRKTDHIELALMPEHQGQASSPFDMVRFEHNALPEIALTDIDLSSQFLGQQICAPIMIGAMTGGCDKGDTINRPFTEQYRCHPTARAGIRFCPESRGCYSGKCIGCAY